MSLSDEVGDLNSLNLANLNKFREGREFVFDFFCFVFANEMISNLTAEQNCTKVNSLTDEVLIFKR